MSDSDIRDSVIHAAAAFLLTLLPALFLGDAGALLGWAFSVAWFHGREAGQAHMKAKAAGIRLDWRQLLPWGQYFNTMEFAAPTITASLVLTLIRTW